MTDRIEVVSAAIIRRGEDGTTRLLLGQRKPGSSYPHLWCTPGRKVDPNEGPAHALARELREEVSLAEYHVLKLFLDDPKPIYEHEMVSSTTGKPARVRCYAFHAPSAFKAQALDGLIGVGWFAKEQLAFAALAPADHANRGVLLDLLAI